MTTLSTLVLLSLVALVLLVEAGNKDITYTLTPKLEPWGKQRTNETARLWGEDMFWQNTPGLRIKFPKTKKVPMIESHTWEIAGWNFKFIQLAKDEKYYIPKTGHLIHLSVHRGKLKTDTGDVYYQIMAAPEDVITTYIGDEVTYLKAKKNTIFSIWGLDPEMAHKEITTMTPEPFTTERDVTLRGPYSSSFKWVRFEEFFSGPVGFDSDFYNLRGFEVYDHKDVRIFYVQFWTAGQQVNCGYHDHQDLTAETSYAELHLTLAYGGGGMQWFEGDVEQPVLHLEEGYSHGPLFHVHDDWTPVRNNGVVSYPTHRWINPGYETDSPNAYDLWAVFEYREVGTTAAPSRK